MRRSGLVRTSAAAVALFVGAGGCAREREAGPAPPTSAPGPSATSGTAEPGTTVRPAVLPVGEVVHGELATPDGRTRTYRLYIPSSLSTAAPAPLLVALHGGLGWGDQFADTNHLEGLAEANGFVVVHPDGNRILERAPSAVWNGGYCCGPAVEDDVDDVGFVSMLLDVVEQKLAIDPTRVFAAGHSNGGIMSYRLACELGDRIVGIGVVGASLGIEDCAPAAPVSLIHVHGTADENHPIDGGPGEGIADVEFHAAIDGVTTIARADGCDTTPTSTTRGDITTDRWNGCRNDSVVEYVRIAGASHAWPGGTPGRRVSGPTYEGYDASAAIWAFLIAHPRP